MEEINKIEFLITKLGSKVSDLSIEIMVNDKKTTDYNYEALNFYKINNDVSSVCEMEKHIRLDNDYIFNYNEEYVVEISELSINNMTYNAIIWTGGAVYINGKPMHEYASNYCMGSKYEEGDSESFRFTLSKDIIDSTSENTTTKVIEDNTNINNNGENTTVGTISQNIVNDKNVANDKIYLSIFIPVIIFLILIIALLAIKNKKLKEANKINN